MGTVKDKSNIFSDIKEKLDAYFAKKSPEDLHRILTEKYNFPKDGIVIVLDGVIRYEETKTVKDLQNKCEKIEATLCRAIEILLKHYERAKNRKDWATADSIRNDLKSLGVKITYKKGEQAKVGIDLSRTTIEEVEDDEVVLDYLLCELISRSNNKHGGSVNEKINTNTIILRFAGNKPYKIPNVKCDLSSFSSGMVGHSDNKYVCSSHVRIDRNIIEEVNKDRERLFNAIYNKQKKDKPNLNNR